MRRGLVWLGCVVVGVVALVVVLVLAANTGPGRRWTCAKLSSTLSSALRGRVEAGRCEALWPGRLRVAEVALYGAGSEAGAPLARVGALEVQPDLGALLHGALRVSEVRIESPSVSLRKNAKGGLALLDALESASPSPPEEASSGELPEVTIDRIALTDGAVTDLPDALRVRALGADVGVQVGDGIVVEVRSVAADARRGGASVLRIERARGVVRIAEGARSELELAARLGAGSAALTADVVWGQAMPSRLDAKLRADVHPAWLRAMGQGDAADALRAPVGVTLSASGSLDALDATLLVQTAGGHARLVAHYAEARADAKLDVEQLALGKVLDGFTAEDVLSAHAAATVTDPLGLTGSRAITLALQGVRFGPWALPELRATGTLHDVYFELASLALPYLTRDHGSLDVHGRVGFDGAMRLRLRADLPDLGADPNLTRLASTASTASAASAASKRVRRRADAALAGALRADVRVRTTASGAVDAEGSVSERELRAGGRSGVSVPALTPDGRASNPLPARAHRAHRGRRVRRDGAGAAPSRRGVGRR
ncbi:MAG: hypothetical protein KC543_14300, partial [Myxococcales bacterium]|nr:hypothetical protein [Myxococcales bacterium]